MDERGFPSPEARILYETLRLLCNHTEGGWAKPQDLYTVLEQQGWLEAGYDDPNYVVHELKELGAVEVELRLGERGERLHLFRHSLGFLQASSPGARSRPSALADRVG